MPSSLQGFVENIAAEYVHGSHLSNVLHRQSPRLYNGQAFSPVNHYLLGADKLSPHCKPLNVAVTHN